MITRQLFLRIVSVAVSATAVGCGDSDTTDGTDGPVCNGVNATVGQNHGHVLGIPPSDVAAGVDKTYDIKGTSQHTHSVTITAAQFETLRAGQALTIDSTRAGAPDHLHSCGIVCVEN